MDVKGIIDAVEKAFILMIGGLILAWLNRLSPKIEAIFKHKKKHLPLEKELERDQKITALLNRTMGELQADRVFYSKLHNGDSAETTRKSRIYEVVSEGMQNDFEMYQNVPIGLVPEEMKMVDEPGSSWMLLEDLHDCKFKRLLQISGIRAIARCAVQRNKRTIGLVGADYVRKVEKPENIERLCYFAGILESILELYE